MIPAEAARRLKVAAAFQRAAKRNPQNAPRLLKAAKALQIAAEMEIAREQKLPQPSVGRNRRVLGPALLSPRQK